MTFRQRYKSLNDVPIKKNFFNNSTEHTNYTLGRNSELLVLYLVVLLVTSRLYWLHLRWGLTYFYHMLSFSPTITL